MRLPEQLMRLGADDPGRSRAGTSTLEPLGEWALLHLAQAAIIRVLIKAGEEALPIAPGWRSGHAPSSNAPEMRWSPTGSPSTKRHSLPAGSPMGWVGSRQLHA